MRLKLIAGNLIIVLLVGLGSYLVVRTQLRTELGRLEVDFRTHEARSDGEPIPLARPRRNARAPAPRNPRCPSS